MISFASAGELRVGYPISSFEIGRGSPGGAGATTLLYLSREIEQGVGEQVALADFPREE
jgi:hypothetical protein